MHTTYRTHQLPHTHQFPASAELAEYSYINNVVKFRIHFLFHPQQRKAEEDAKKKHETEMDYLAPFLAQIGDPSQLSRAEAYKLKEECLQDLKQRLIDRANLIQARFEKVRSLRSLPTFLVDR